MERTLFVAIIGLPNVGKSSLLNRIVGAKIAIVSPKRQTTRSRITGILTRGDTQYVFIDTPGFHRPATRLGEHMTQSVRSAIGDVDAALFVCEPKESFNEAETELLDGVRKRRLPAVLAVNKSDLVQSERTDKCIDELKKQYPFDDAAAISALTGDGVEELLERLGKYSVEGPHLFDEDALTDQPERVIAAEIIREKLLLNLFDEIPHGTAVAVESFKERENSPIVDIDAVIYCERDNHKGMIIGKGGAMLKKVASQARVDIEDFLDTKVNLKCWVKVREDWKNKESIIRDLGLV